MALGYMEQRTAGGARRMAGWVSPLRQFRPWERGRFYAGWRELALRFDPAVAGFINTALYFWRARV